jgi:predicted ATPase
MWRAAASGTPTVMVMDDLHWSDEASVELLIDLLPLVEEVPLGILCAFRPELQSPAWRFRQHTEVEYPHLYTEINLGRLSDDDSNDLVNNLLAVADLPDETRGLILQKTDGNPYFVEEVTRSLIESGAVERDQDSSTWRVTKDIADIAIPDNLQGLSSRVWTGWTITPAARCSSPRWLVETSTSRCMTLSGTPMLP